jgi:hypothetical protein
MAATFWYAFMKIPAYARTPIYAGLILLLGLGAYLYFNHHFERVEHWVETGWQGEAARNPLLAAQRLLRRLGWEAYTLRSLPLEQLSLDPQDSLLLWQEYETLPPPLSQSLLEWVKEGGHLFLSSNEVEEDAESEENDSDSSDLEQAESADFLLRSLRVTLHRVHEIDNTEEIILDNVEADLLEFEWQEQWVQVNFSPRYYLLHHNVLAHTLVKADKGAYVLQVPWGRGQVTIFSDLFFMDNDNIGAYDHALFLHQILQLQRPPHKIWLLFPDVNLPSLWHLLWAWAWAFISSSVILISAWLWSVSGRFGAIMPPPPSARRQILEHLEASGYFLWHHGQSAHLHATVIRAVYERLSVRRPDWLKLSAPELNTRLAQLSHQPSAHVQDALTPSTGAVNPDIFTRRIQTLEKIRNAL